MTRWLCPSGEKSLHYPHDEAEGGLRIHLGWCKHPVEEHELEEHHDN